MSGAMQLVTVIRLVRLEGSGADVSRALVAGVTSATFLRDAASDSAFLIVPTGGALTSQRDGPHHVADIRVGDVVGWVAEPYGALWIADRTRFLEGAPTGTVDSACGDGRRQEEDPCSRYG